MLADRGRCCNETQKNGRGVRKLNTVRGGAGARREGGEEVVVGRTVGLWRPMLDGSDWRGGRCTVTWCGGCGGGGGRSDARRADDADSAKGEGDQLELADSFLSIADNDF